MAKYKVVQETVVEATSWPQFNLISEDQSNEYDACS